MSPSCVEADARPRTLGPQMKGSSRIRRPYPSQADVLTAEKTWGAPGSRGSFGLRPRSLSQFLDGPRVPGEDARSKRGRLLAGAVYSSESVEAERDYWTPTRARLRGPTVKPSGRLAADSSRRTDLMLVRGPPNMAT